MSDTARTHDEQDPADSEDAKPPTTETPPPTSGHSDAATQAERNEDDESPA